jgi:hypothetical protein
MGRDAGGGKGSTAGSLEGVRSHRNFGSHASAGGAAGPDGGGTDVDAGAGLWNIRVNSPGPDAVGADGGVGCGSGNGDAVGAGFGVGGELKIRVNSPGTASADGDGGGSKGFFPPLSAFFTPNRRVNSPGSASVCGSRRDATADADAIDARNETKGAMTPVMR